MPDAHGWIKVEDALPKNPKWRWAWLPKNLLPLFTNVVDAFYAHGEWRDSMHRVIEPTHHQPMKYPEPPEDA